MSHLHGGEHLFRNLGDLHLHLLLFRLLLFGSFLFGHVDLECLHAFAFLDQCQTLLLVAVVGIFRPSDDKEDQHHESNESIEGRHIVALVTVLTELVGAEVLVAVGEDNVTPVLRC